MRHSLIQRILLVLFALLLAVLSHAQDTTTRLSGTVTDASGGVIPDATINLRNEATRG